MNEKLKIKNINDLLDVFENTDGYYLGDYTCFQIADYIRKMYNQLQKKENIIKKIKSQLDYLETYSSKEDVYEDMSRRLNRIEKIIGENNDK